MLLSFKINFGQYYHDFNLLKSIDKIKWLSSCLRVIDNPLHKSIYIGCASLNTNSKVPSLFDLPAKILRKMSAPSKERAAAHRLCCARN